MPEGNWFTFEEHVQACCACDLHRGIRNKVPGQGDPHSPLMFIGEGPGEQEDAQGLAFVGAAGQLLTRMLQAISLPRERVYICNVVKCRPPGNRTPDMQEMQACLPLLREQFLLVRPRIIILLGATAARAVLNPDIRITRDRGRWVERKGVWFMATYHPSYLLRSPERKAEAWKDLQSLRAQLMAMKLYPDLYDTLHDN